MTTAEQSPQDKLNTKMRMIRSKVQSLQSEVRLARLSDLVEDIDSDISKANQRIGDLRTNGYVFGKGLETRAKEYSIRWSQMKPNICRQIESQAPGLQQEMGRLANQLSQLEVYASNPTQGLPMAERLEKNLETFESKVNAADSEIRGMFDRFSTEIAQTKTELDRIEWTLVQIAEACFKLMPSECGIMAVKARYSREDRIDKDDPQGVLYLTDQRLIFEQKEEVATKKFLFIATEKEKVQNLLFETPVGLVEKIETSKKGLFKNEDHMSLIFKHGAPVRMAFFHLNGQDCNLWQALINRAGTSDFDQDRTVAVDEKLIEKVRNAPSQCPNCGAPVQQQVLRGMDSIKCEYCQHVMRL